MRKAVRLFFVMGFVWCLANIVKHQQAQRLKEAKRYYQRTGDIETTLMLYPNIKKDSLIGGR